MIELLEISEPDPITKFSNHENLYEKHKYIKLVGLDFDGVFTDCRISLDYNMSLGFRRLAIK